MTALWLAPAMMIASGSIHAVVNAILKGGKDKMAGRATIDGSSALLLLPATLLVPLPHGAWGWLGMSAAIHCLYLYALVRAFETSDFSAAYPIMRGTAPLLTTALAVGLFGERASPQELAGIAVIGVAVSMLVFGKHIGRAGIGWALLTAAMIGCYTVTDAHGVRAAPTPASYIIWSFVVSGTAIVTMFALVSRGRIFAGARTQWRAGLIAGGAVDLHVRDGAERLLTGADRAARGASRDGHGDRAADLDPVPQGARDVAAWNQRSRYPGGRGADPDALA